MSKDRFAISLSEVQRYIVANTTLHHEAPLRKVSPIVHLAADRAEERLRKLMESNQKED